MNMASEHQYFCLFRGENGRAWLHGLATTALAVALWEGLSFFLPAEARLTSALFCVLLFLTNAIMSAVFIRALAGAAAGVFGFTYLNWRGFDVMDTMMVDPFWMVLSIVLMVVSVVVVAYHAACSSRAREKYLADLLMSLSHDIKTPLSTIKGTLSTLHQLGDKLDAEDLKDLLSGAEQEASRLDRYFNNVVDMARLEGAQVTLHQESLQVESLINELLTAYQAQGVVIQYEVEAAPQEMRIQGDKILLHKAIRQIIDNAISFAPAGSPIRMQSEYHAKCHQWQLVVQDEGAGLPKEMNNRCNRLARAELRDKSSCYGSGFGLVIAESIMKLHGGRIDFREASPVPPQVGCRIRLCLPAVCAS